MSDGIFEELMNFRASTEEGEKEVVKKLLKPSEKLLAEIANYGFNMTQLGEVIHTKGSQLIISSAGSGKTTAIIFKIIYDLKSGRSTVVKELNGNSVRVPDKIWVATFLKSGADELKNSYRKWSNKLHCADMAQVIQFSTLHAEFKRALSALGLNSDIIPDADNRKLLKKVLKVYGIRNPRGGNLSEDDISSLIGAFTRTRNRLDAERYVSDVYEEYRLVDSIIEGILRDWKNERILLDKVDFEDLQEILYDYCYVRKDKGIISFLANRFNYLYIDEFQDTSQIQYALLKVYCSEAKQIIAIGDDDQTIYSWRGSDNNIITKNFLEDFHPIKSDLSINYRCPSNILNAIKPSIKNNTYRFDKVLHSAKEGGEVRVGEYAGYRSMALALGDLVYKDVQEGKSVAVLCRVNSDGLLPALFFDKMNRFTYSISSTGMSLDSYIGRVAISIVKLFTDSYSSDVVRALKLLTWDSYGISKLVSICKSNNVNIWTVNPEDLKYSCIEIADTVLSWRDFRNTAGDIPALKLVLESYRFNVFTKDTQFNDVMRSVLVSIESLLDYYNYDSVEDFLSELMGINDRLKAREKATKCKVKITTVHEFKGKEADSVYIWNDSKDVFPYKRSMGNTYEMEEERRIHYIAGTRAKQSSTVMYLKGKKGMFIDEMDLSNASMLEKKTSGVLKKSMESDAEVVKGLEEFKKEVSEEEYTEADDAVIGAIVVGT